VLDLAREPRWSRTDETYGEDPYLVSRIGVAAIEGYQGEGPFLDKSHVFATAKHFAVHGQPEGGTNALSLGPSELSFLNREMRRVVEPAEFRIMVGGNSEELIEAKLSVVEK
jgi:beta-glucosidase-like glycosyl hydrolase